MPTTFDAQSLQPAFSAITAEIAEALVEGALADHASAIRDIVSDDAPSVASTIVRKEQADAAVGAVVAAVSHLAAVCDTPDYRAAHRRIQPKMSRYFSELGQNAALLSKIEAVRDGEEALSLVEARAIALAVRDFRLSGIALPQDDRERFVAISTELAKLSMAFGNAVLDATQAWSRVVSEEELDGLPDRARAILAGNARSRGMEGWVATLDQPSVEAVLSFAGNRDLRFAVYEANVTRASEVGPHAGRFDNGERMCRILRLRRDAAGLLGFGNSVANSLATRMAQDRAEVATFLDDLVDRVKPFAERELAALRTFARDALGIETLEPWDFGYAAEKLRHSVHSIDPEEISRFFPLDHVLRGLFDHVRDAFGVELREEPGADTWHADVRHVVAKIGGTPVASLYLDLHARAGKQGRAWMHDGRARVRGAIQRPIAFLTCNFAPPSDEAPVLLRHVEVVTLFHEMGHCLHHILTEVDLPSVGGISGVEWDAVELPSQLNESFAWDRIVLKQISSHVETGVPLPTELIDQMVAARDFQAATGLLRQVKMALLDIGFHSLADPSMSAIEGVLRDVEARCGTLPMPAWNRFAHAFLHIFAGSYGAGYYSYLWAERLSADAFEAFLEDQSSRAELGQTFRREVLARGASRPAIDNYVAFRGRQPNSDALLRRRGIAA